MLFLNVPYNEKDEAKSLGAKWNGELKKWYVEKREDYVKFNKWLCPDTDEFFILCDYIYIAVGEQECFKCKKPTRIIGLGTDNFLHFFREWEDDEDKYGTLDSEEWFDIEDIHIVPISDFLPEKILKTIMNNFNFKERYSKTTETSGLSNCCENCDMLQGNYFIFSEVNSPFFIDSQEKAEKIRLYKVKIKDDILYDGDFSYGSEDYLIKKCAKIIDVESIDKLDEILKKDKQ